MRGPAGLSTGEYAEDIDDKLIISELNRKTELKRRFEEWNTKIERFMSDVTSILARLPMTNSNFKAADVESESTLREKDNRSNRDVGRLDPFSEGSATIVEDIAVNNIEVNGSLSASQLLQDDKEMHSDEIQVIDHDVKYLSDKLEGLPDTEDDEDSGIATPQDSDDDRVLMLNRALAPECLRRPLDGDRLEEEEDIG